MNADETLEHGWQLYHERAYDAALAELETALAGGADAAVAHWRIGWCHRGLKDPERARQSFERAVAAAPDAGWTHRELGRHFGLNGAFREALPHFARSIERDPHVPLTYHDTGSCLGHVGYPDLSLVCYTICGVLCAIVGEDQPTGVSLVQFRRSLAQLERILGAKRYWEIQTPVYAVCGIAPGEEPEFVPADAFEKVAAQYILPPLRQIAGL